MAIKDKIFDPPDSANEALFDSLVRHQIYLLRLSGNVRNKVQKILDQTEEDIRGKILARLADTTGRLRSPTELRRLETLLRIVRNIRTKAWEQVDAAWARELKEIAKAEPELVARMIAVTSPAVVEMVLPASHLLTSIVTSQPFEGATMREWARSIRRADLRRIEGAIRIGMLQGETAQQITRRVLGSRSLNGADGVTATTRREAAAITRTAISHVTNTARTLLFLDNADLMSGEQFVATLDSRTTPVCRANDGKVFPVGEGPQPPLHWGCRSLRVPVLEANPQVNRPSKPVTEKMLLREYAQQKGIKAPGTRAGLPRGTKTAFDNFARKRIRELTGTVPDSVSYQEWLTRQSAEFQDDVLGRTRGRLFRRGGLELDRFVNRSGDELPLSELAKRHSDAFRAAGLDPSDF